MNEIFQKNIGILSKEMIKKLNKSLIILFGLGGVGGYTFEALLRAGIGNFIIIDKDKFEITNLNRQLASNIHTIGQYKTNIYKDRAKTINTDVNIMDLILNVEKDNVDKIFKCINDFKDVNNVYVSDCIDDIDAKIEIIKICYQNNIKLISCMGTANHFSSKNIKISKLKNTKYCPIAKRIRNYFKNNSNINPNVLFIEEEPIDISKNVNNNIHISTIQFVPAICGMKIAEYIIKNILKY